MFVLFNIMSLLCDFKIITLPLRLKFLPAEDCAVAEGNVSVWTSACHDLAKLGRYTGPSGRNWYYYVMFSLLPRGQKAPQYLGKGSQELLKENTKR